MATVSAAIDTMVRALEVQPGRRTTDTDDLDPAQGSSPAFAEPDTAEEHTSDEGHDHWPGEGEEDELDEDETRRPGRRVTIAVALAAPLMFVGAFFAGGWIIDKVQNQPPSPSAIGLRAQPPPAASGDAAPGTTKPAATPFVPGGAAGPGLTEPGVLVQATPTADGSLEVVERVRFSGSVSELTLGPPLTRGMAARSLPSDIKIADLQVQADQAVVDIGVRGLAKARTVALPSSSSTVVMRYRLTGATVRSIPSIPGRALTVLPPITSAATLGSLPFVVEVSGAEVTNVLCPGLATDVQLCGRTWSKGWYAVPQRAGRTAVLAQLDLPDPVGG